MADDIDRAQDHEAWLRDEALKQRRAEVGIPAQPTGFCLYCDAAIEEGRFCPAEDGGVSECATEWQAEQEILRRQGLA